MPVYQHRVQLRWPLPERGEIKVVRAGPEATLSPGDEFPEEELERHGLVLQGWPPIRDTRIREVRLCQYIPVLILEGHCYVGHARRYAAVPEAGELRAEYVGTSVRLSWSWPEAGDEVLVAWDENAEPPDPVAAKLQARVVRSGHDEVGTYDIPARAARQVFAQVAVVVRESGAEFISSGAATSVQWPSAGLRYEIKPARGLGGRRLELVLRPERPAWLPALELHGRSDSRPAGRHDQLLLQIPRALVEREQAIKLAPGKPVQLRSCRLFVADESEAYIVHIIDPE